MAETIERKLRNLARKVDRARASPGGPGVRIWQRPWGYVPSYTGATSFSPPIWRVTLRGGRENLRLTIGRGLVNGVEPVIGEGEDAVPISGAFDKAAPELAVPVETFGETGQALLYLRAEFTFDWVLSRVTPVPLAAKPPATPWAAHKLLGFLVSRSGGVRYEQMAFHNLGLGTLFDRRSNGLARYVWYAV